MSFSTCESPERPHQCSECGLWFRRLEHLQRHVLVHSGAKPFECSVCKRGFNRFDALQRHSKMHGTKPTRPKNTPRAPSIRKPKSKHVFHYFSGPCRACDHDNRNTNNNTNTKNKKSTTRTTSMIPPISTCPCPPDFSRLAKEATRRVMDDRENSNNTHPRMVVQHCSDSRRVHDEHCGLAVLADCCAKAREMNVVRCAGDASKSA
ncbi:hypothetical protein DFJ77DRAFT_243232 [Powellomyces hirtus]|nr:hypothetical protein DFJ77DRAFT_243232 [Powellomyces hirtus]